MDITLIGANDLFARGFATWAVSAGHDLTTVGWNRAVAGGFAASVGAKRAAGPGDPLRDDLIVMAFPYVCLRPVLESYGGKLDGKVVVDLITPLDLETFEPVHPETGSSAEEIARARAAAMVVKAFSPRFLGAPAGVQNPDQDRDVLLAGDDDGAKRMVAQLFEGSGLRPIDLGLLRRSRELEALGYLHVAVRQRLEADVEWAKSHS